RELQKTTASHAASWSSAVAWAPMIGRRKGEPILANTDFKEPGTPRKSTTLSPGETARRAGGHRQADAIDWGWPVGFSTAQSVLTRSIAADAPARHFQYRLCGHGRSDPPHHPRRR